MLRTNHMTGRPTLFILYPTSQKRSKTALPFLCVIRPRVLFLLYRLEEISCPVGASRGVLVSIDNPVGRDIVLTSKVNAGAVKHRRHTTSFVYRRYTCRLGKRKHQLVAHAEIPFLKITLTAIYVCVQLQLIYSYLDCIIPFSSGMSSCARARKNSNHRNFSVEPAQIVIGPYGTASFEVNMLPTAILQGGGDRTAQVLRRSTNGLMSTGS